MPFSLSKLVPGGDGSLAHLSDSELLANTRGLVARSNQRKRQERTPR